jgi:DNA-binding NtrC family response regulator
MGGAAFILELPAAEQAAPSVSQNGDRPAKREPTAAGGLILVVDDERSIRETLRKALHRAGHEVIACGSGLEALEELGNRSVDVILLDHRMSGMDGTELYLEAINLRPELTGRALIMTGDTLNPKVTGFAAEHGLRLVAKPFDLNDLLAIVDAELATGARTPA